MSPSVKTFVIGSVLLNLLLIGIVGGHLTRSLMGPDGRRSPEEIMRSIPAERRASFEETYAHMKNDITPIRRQIDAARLDTLCLLHAQPLDKKAYLAKVAQLQTLHKQLYSRVAETIVANAPTSTPEERIGLIDMLRSTPPATITPKNCEQ